MMRNIRSVQLAILCLTMASPLLAKRLPPKPVPPVQLGGVEYSVPHGEKMGFVVATDLKSKTVLWQRQIYTVWIEPSLEQDAQYVYITSIKPKGMKLVVTNEKGFKYELDLKSLIVRPIKGSLVLRQLPR